MQQPRFFRRLIDPSSAEHAIASGVILGALTLIDPQRRGPGGRLILRTGLGVLTGLTTWLSLRQDPLLARNPVGTAGIAVGAAGAAVGLSEAGEALDRRIRDGLRTRGISRPRAVMALGVGAFAMFAALLQSRDTMRILDPETEDIPDLTELDSGPRAVIAGILEFTGDHDSAALRTQLDGVRAEVWNTPWVDEDTVHLRVADSVPLAIPHDFVFPVRARFRRKNAHWEAQLDISEGKLAMLRMEKLDIADSEDSADAAPGGWPTRADLTFVLDSRS